MIEAAFYGRLQPGVHQKAFYSFLNLKMIGDDESLDDSVVVVKNTDVPKEITTKLIMQIELMNMVSSLKK